MNKILLYVTGAVLIAALTFGGWQWYQANKLQSEVTQLISDNTQLSNSNEALELSNQQLQAWQQQSQQLLNDLNEAFANAEQPLQEIQSLLARHDLERLATERPGLIERRINDATREVFDSIQCATGNC